jgi:DNA-binding response OmpR family regulator
MSNPLTVLLVERGSPRYPSLSSELRERGYILTIRRTVNDALSDISVEQPDIAVIDAASMQTSGVRMSRQLAERLNGTPLLLLCPEGTPRSSRDTADADVVLVHPFSSRKVLNRIALLRPPARDHELRMGPIRLDVGRRILRCRHNSAKLTPKLCSLLRLLIANSGKVIRREELMRQVWDTDYTGDMRTIDVHMSWLRKVLEPDPSSPRYLKTVRGIGYRLDFPDPAH